MGAIVENNFDSAHIGSATDAGSQRMLGSATIFLSLLGRHFNMARTCCCVVCCLVQGLRPVCVSRLPPVFLNH